jgi:hypothetical protein
MDAEAARQLTDAVENLTNVMNNAGGKLSGLGDAATKASQSQQNYNKGVISGTEASLSYAEAQRKAKAAAKNMSDAQDQAKAALWSFTTGLNNTSTEFAKYNGTLQSAGDAALSLGKNFGLVGLAIGGLIKGVTMAAQQATKQADNSLKATDEFNKMGAAGGHTAKSIAEMGIKIGLSNEQFGLMPKALKKAGEGIVSLGATTADGQKKFMAMLAVTNQQREAFQRLGIGQEELMEKQSEYIALQGMSGKSLVNQAKDGDKLRKSSLEYTENLLRLSALTGKDADKIAKEQQIANLAYEEVIQTRIEDDKIRKLNAEKRFDEAKALEDEQKARKQFITDATVRLGEETGLQLAKVMRTGAFDESTKGIAQLGIDATEVAAQLKKAKPGEEVANLFNDTYKTVQTKVGQNLAQFGTSLQFGGQDMGKALGLNQDLVTKTGVTAGRDEKEAERLAKLNMGKPSEGTTGATAAEDPAQIARNKSTTLTIEFNKALETLLLESNPLMSGFNALTIAMTALVAAAGAAALALGALAAKSTLGTIADMATGPGGQGQGGAGKGRAGKLFGTLKNVGGKLLRGGVAVAGGAAVDYGLGKLGVGKDKEGNDLQVDEKQDDANWAKMSTGEKMQSGVLRGIEKAGDAFFLGNMTKQAQADRIKNETNYLNKNTPGAAPAAAPAASPVAMGNEGNRAKPTPQPPEGSEDNNTSAKAVDLSKILKFGSNSGSKENFEGLNSTFKDAVIAAATEYNAVTGNMIIINSAKRSSEDQQRLYDNWVARGKTGMPVGKPGRSLHEKGHAVDIQNYNDSAAVAAFNKQGLSQKVPNDPVHFQASDGAMVSGSASGYPVEATFHGNEIVAPLDPDSILTKLAKTSASELSKEFSTSSSSSTTENIISSNAEMIDLMKMFVEKMDNFIDAQSDSNSIQTELLQYSKA